MTDQKAEFVERGECINCGATNLRILSSGYFSEEPLRGFIEKDPWGESPLPYVDNEQWAFVLCEDCSQKYHKRILSPEWVERCYSEWVTQEAMEEFLADQDTPAHHFEKAREHALHILRLEKLTRDLRKDRSLRILDFGCGWGEFLSACDRFGFKSYGIDFAPDRRRHGRIHIFPSVDDLKQTEREAASFHVITMFEVLEHLADPFGVLQSLNELLVPGGIVVLETPDCTGVADIASIKDYRKIHPLSHINGFTPDTLRSIAQRAGYNPIRCGVAHATSDVTRVIKTEAKRILGPMMKPSTQQYFRKR